ncbi:class I SAM-dependent methyltransferase [Candidatus Nomurabacteria bacterium]|nr:class I SAM-dependent methyltransferase [Candidatus Nomurabacteria bacterium]
MKEITSKQYNNWSEEHDRDTMKYDQLSRKSFYSFFKFETNEKKLLDIASGTGHDLQHYRDGMKCDVWGVDASEKEVEIANDRLGEDKVKVGYAEALPYEDNSFDIVVSKYAPQGFEDIEPFYKEVNRVLKTGGYFLILTTHPMRHFLEKTEKPRDYFKKEIVTSWIYNHMLPLQEYSHTMNDYFSDYFFKHFQIEEYLEECNDGPVIEHVDGENYPAYFIYRARKK